MNNRESLLADVIKLDDYIGYVENPIPGDSHRFDHYSDELLQILYDTYIKSLVVYRTWGEGYPSVIELLNIKSAEVISCIENHKEEKKLELQRRNLFKQFTSNTNEDDVYNESFEEDEYCEACQQSPCMCSDREQSSTVHDF